MGSFGRGSAKCFMLAGNLLFFLSGLGLAGLGSWIRVKSKDYDTVLGNKGLQTPANFLIASGVVVFLVAFFGFVGACSENRNHLQFYILFVGLIIFVQVACVTFAFAIRHKTEYYIGRSFAFAISKTYNKAGHEPITKAIDEIQKTLKCCGAYGPDDFMNAQISIPESCDDEKKQIRFEKGCVDEMKDWALRNLLICGGLAVGVLFIELLGILGSISLIRSRKVSHGRPSSASSA